MAENNVRSPRGLVKLSDQEMERFWSKVDRRGPSDCWLWMAAKMPRGYGNFAVFRDGRWQTRYAHRVALELDQGIAPPCVCHRCDNPSCCNPSHLFGGTAKDNIHDMLAKGRGISSDRLSECMRRVAVRGDAWHARYDRHIKRGPEHARATLTADDVREIRQRRATGEYMHDIAASLGVSRTTVLRVINGKRYTSCA